MTNAFPVAQTSKSAVSRISKSAGRGDCEALRHCGRPAGLETGDTAGLETCATTAAAPVAQTSKSAVSQVSKPAGRGQLEARPYGRRPAGLETGDTAGLETCATTTAAPVPQTSKSAVSQISKPAGRGQLEARPSGRRPAGLETGHTARLETCATTAATPVPQTSKSAVSQVSKPADRGQFEACPDARRSTGLETCATSTSPRATPPPFFGSLAQTSRHWVSANVRPDSTLLLIAPNPVVKRLGLPKRLLTQTQKLLRSPRAELLPRLHDVANQEIGHWPEDHMRVIGHHHPVIKHVTLLVEKSHRPGDQFGNVRSPQVAGTRALIEIALNLSPQVAGNFYFGFSYFFASRLRRLNAAQALGPFLFKPEQDLLGQRIRQPNGDEVGGPFAFDMRQITSRMNAGAQRIRRVRRNPVGSQRVAGALQSGVGFARNGRLHGPRLCLVPQTSKSAVSRISKSAGRGAFEALRHCGRSAGLETGDTAGLETCATTNTTPVPQTSKSAVSQVSKPAGRGKLEARPHDRRPAGLEAGDTAGLETCATTNTTPVPQTSKSAVSQVSKPAGRGKLEARPHGRRPAGLEAGDTAGLETCATTART